MFALYDVAKNEELPECDVKKDEEIFTRNVDLHYNTTIKWKKKKKKQQR